MYWDDGRGGIGWVLAVVAMMVLMTALVVLAFEVLGRGRHQVGDSARRILGERLARGEIDIEEYQSRIAVLRDAG
jgi:putative membrane protein